MTGRDVSTAPAVWLCGCGGDRNYDHLELGGWGTTSMVGYHFEGFSVSANAN